MGEQPFLPEPLEAKDVPFQELLLERCSPFTAHSFTSTLPFVRSQVDLCGSTNKSDCRFHDSSSKSLYEAATRAVSERPRRCQ